MSAKGDQVGERFVKVMGIVDYITKPFSPEAITAVVQHTIEKYPKQASSPARQTVDGRRAAADAGASRRPSVDADGLGRSRTAPALQGNLRAVPLAEVLGLLAAQRQWGVLTVTRADGAAAIDVCFKQGRIELALAHGLGEEFLLGRYLVEASTMSRQDLDLFLEGRAPQSRTGKPIGEQLRQDELRHRGRAQRGAGAPDAGARVRAAALAGRALHLHRHARAAAAGRRGRARRSTSTAS